MNKIVLPIYCLLMACCDVIFGQVPVNYSSYVHLNSSKFFNTRSNWGGGIDFFVPLWQSHLKHLVFANFHIVNRTNYPYEGSINLGYRQLTSPQLMWGFFGAFDRSRDEHGVYFNQLAFGAELWHNNIFYNGNIYLPIGTKQHHLSTTVGEYGLAIKAGSLYKYTTINKQSAVACYGFDFNCGYEFSPYFTLYAGIYRFWSHDLTAFTGPKIKIVTDFITANRRLLGLFDQISLELGLRNDRRGTQGYLGINLRIGLSQQSQPLNGLNRHMIDPIHRETNVFTAVKDEQTVHFQKIKILMQPQPPPPPPSPSPQDPIAKAKTIVYNDGSGVEDTEVIMELSGSQEGTLFAAAECDDLDEDAKCACQSCVEMFSPDAGVCSTLALERHYHAIFSDASFVQYIKTIKLTCKNLEPSDRVYLTHESNRDGLKFISNKGKWFVEISDLKNRDAAASLYVSLVKILPHIYYNHNNLLTNFMSDDPWCNGTASKDKQTGRFRADTFQHTVYCRKIFAACRNNPNYGECYKMFVEAYYNIHNECDSTKNSTACRTEICNTIYNSSAYDGNVTVPFQGVTI